MKPSALSFVIASVLATRALFANPCNADKLARGTPLRLVMGPASLGSVPEACGADEAALVASGSALIAISDFYGLLGVDVAARGRWRFDERNWISFVVPGLDYRFSANATVEAASLDLGAGALGFHHAVAGGDRVQVTPYARVLLPSETVYHNARRWGFDQGLSAIWRIAPKFELDGGTSFPLLSVVNGSRALTTLVPTADADLVVTPWRVFAGVVGVSLRVRSGRDAGLESFDPRAGLRLWVGGHFELELAAAAPLAGRDRTDVIASLYVGWVDQSRSRFSP